MIVVRMKDDIQQVTVEKINITEHFGEMVTNIEIFNHDDLDGDDADSD